MNEYPNGHFGMLPKGGELGSARDGGLELIRREEFL